MNKTGWFFSSFLAWIMAFMLLGTSSPEQIPSPPSPPIVQPPASPLPPLEPDCVGVQVPIPKAARIYNKSGSQCVWCTIETLARYHGIKELYEGDKNLTKHYTWATGAGEVSRVLSSNYSTVKWRQIQNRSQMKDFIKKYVTVKKFGVGLGIPGHMLTLVHYDETAGIVKVIDNGGPKSLQVQDWTMDKFNRLAEGWVLTVFPPGYYETSTKFDTTIIETGKLYY